MTVAQDPDGSILVAVTSCTSIDDLQNFDDAPMPLALLAAWVGGRCLLVFDRWKGCWELPGGGREPGEAALEAAMREFTEETGLVAVDPCLAAVAEFVLPPDARREYGAVFGSGRVLDPAGAPVHPASAPPFEPNAEIQAVHWWDPASPWPGTEPGDARLIDEVLARSTVYPNDATA